MGPINLTSDESILLSTVSWQSCFWALMPIALNTMCQPSGRILGYSSKYNFALRCSPIVCATDALHTAVQLFTLTIKKDDRGLREILDARFKDSTSGEHEGSFAALRQNQTFRLLIALLGALPQALKLYACNGIPATKACCTAYLASFIVDEILVTTRPYVHPGVNSVQSGRTRSSNKHEVNSYFARGVLLTNFVALYAIFYAGFRELVQATFSNYGFLVIFDMALFGFFWMPIISVQTTSSFSFSKRKLETMAHLTWAILSLIAVVTGSVLFAFGSLSARPEIDVLTSVLTWMTGIGILFLSEEELQHAANQFIGNQFPGLGKYFLLLHLAAAMMYYVFCYDQTNTYKPAWTEYLG